MVPIKGIWGEILFNKIAKALDFGLDASIDIKEACRIRLNVVVDSNGRPNQNKPIDNPKNPAPKHLSFKRV